MTAAEHPKAVPIVMGGRTRYLLFTLGAFEKMETLGVNPYEMSDAVTRTAKWQCAALWAGLLKDDPTLTPEQVADWVDLENLAEVLGTVTEAFNRSAGKTIQGPDPLAVGTVGNATSS